MKIIKIVHTNIASELEAEGESFILKNYDFNDFLLRQEPKILEQIDEEFQDLLEAQKLEEAKNKSNQKKVMDFFKVALIASPISPIGLLSAGIKHITTEEERRKVFASFAMKRVISEFLDDIKKQVQKVEFLSLEMARAKYSKTQNLSIGTYTLHPRDSLRLTRIEHYHKNLALEKDDELIVLLGRMGAKSLRTIESDTQQQSVSANLKMNTTQVDVNEVKAGMSISQNLGKSQDLLVKFEGNVVDINHNLLSNSLCFSDDRLRLVLLAAPQL